MQHYYVPAKATTALRRRSSNQLQSHGVLHLGTEHTAPVLVLDTSRTMVGTSRNAPALLLLLVLESVEQQVSNVQSTLDII